MEQIWISAAELVKTFLKEILFKKYLNKSSISNNKCKLEDHILREINRSNV